MVEIKLIDCETMFSNGTEYEWFLDHNCFQCKRFRNWQCAIVHRLEMARFDETVFPYEHLWDYEKYGGKKCKKFTTEPIRRYRRNVKGQIAMDLEGLT